MWPDASTFDYFIIRLYKLLFELKKSIIEHLICDGLVGVTLLEDLLLACTQVFAGRIYDHFVGKGIDFEEFIFRAIRVYDLLVRPDIVIYYGLLFVFIDVAFGNGDVITLQIA